MADIHRQYVVPLKSNVGPKVDGLAASEREDQLLYSPQRTAILTEASQALSLRPSVVLATNPSAEPQSSHAKPRRATSKGVLLQRLESEFWAACRDGDIYKVERMTSTDPLIKEPPRQSGPSEKLSLTVECPDLQRLLGPLEVDALSQVREFKRTLARMVGLGEDLFALMRQDHILEDFKSFADLQVHHGATLVLRTWEALQVGNLGSRESFARLADMSRSVQPVLPDIGDVDFPHQDACYYGIEGGSTCLHIAAICGHAHIVSHLIGLKADIHLATGGGESPLHLAVQFGQSEVVDVLLGAGASLEAVDAAVPPARDQYRNLCTYLHS